MTYSADRGTGARGVPRQVVEAFDHLASRQRGRPERAMLDVLHHYGGGPLSIVEDVGDLIHRMSQHHAYDPGEGRYDVLAKAERALRALRQGYGFRRELGESIATNACFRAEVARGGRTADWHRHSSACGPAIAVFKRELGELLLAYAEEHRKLPVYNRPQQLAQAAAVALGEQRFEDAAAALDVLLALARDRDRWFAEITACRLDGDGRPVPLNLQRYHRGRYAVSEVET